MAAIASLLIALTLSLLVTRIATMALMLTGMSKEAARFQARSAFTGVGYTTDEAENIVGHPVRRRIVMLLMLLGNLGVATVVATLMLSVLQTSESQNWRWKVGLLCGGLLLLWRAATSRYLERHLNRLISFGLRRWGNLQVRDYVAILQLEGGYAVSELAVEPNDWLAERTLIELKLPYEGVLVLGIRRTGGVFLGAPTGDTVIHAGDTIVLYGPVDRIADLDGRRRGKQGDAAHQDAVTEHADELQQQVQIDAKIEQKRQETEDDDE